MPEQHNDLRTATAAFMTEADTIQQGGGSRGIERQHKLGGLTARERLDTLVDKGSPIFECGLFAGWNMYTEYGGAPGAGVVTAIATVGGKLSMIIANDATVKGGSFFAETVRKHSRAQEIAQDHRLPCIYLVDSGGAFLPMQDEVFPDKLHFGRIFRRRGQPGVLEIVDADFQPGENLGRPVRVAHDAQPVLVPDEPPRTRRTPG